MSSASPSLSAQHRIRVLIVDDSAVVRGLISRQLEIEPDVEVVATAADGSIAVREAARLQPDVVVLDVEMPVMDGLSALPELLRVRPGLKVVMASTLTLRNADVSLKALRLGAVDYVSKPQTGLSSAEDFRRELVEKIRLHGRPQRARTSALPSASFVRAASASRPVTPQVLAIGSSTGGPPALMTVFEHLGPVRQPILVTQHMPATFTAMLAEHLTRAGGKPAAEAKDGEPVSPGRVYVAPGGWHMTVEREGSTPVIRLNQEPPEHFCRPAVDPMLRSLASVYGPGVTACILTGMGGDGGAGCEAVARAGGRFIAQDEATSVVWGMPAAAARTGLAERVLPLAEIGPWLADTAAGR